MSEEIKNVEEKKEEKCCCVCTLVKSECFKKFLIVAFGTFVGGFCALSLFAALHKPPMMPQHFGHQFRYGGPMMERGFGHHKHFKKHHKMHKHDFQKMDDMDKQIPNENPQKEIDD